jgi:plasmid stabilization system protein ParE
MAYLVRITSRAERDFASLYQDINAGESDAALKWYRGLKEAVLSLEEHPDRCPVTPEKKQLRHLLYGNKRTFTASSTASWKSRSSGGAPHTARRTTETQIIRPWIIERRPITLPNGEQAVEALVI